MLGIPRSAQLADIKSAYRKCLLENHPDKHQANSIPTDISHIIEAYNTLSSVSLKVDYDRMLNQLDRVQKEQLHKQRPAQVVSLEDFSEVGDTWEYPCRCGDQYRISQIDLEQGVHLIACGSCSEVIWAGYEVADEDELRASLIRQSQRALIYSVKNLDTRQSEHRKS